MELRMTESNHEHNERIEYMEMESLADLSESLTMRLWNHHGGDFVRDSRHDLRGLARVLPRRLLERIVAYAMARTVYTFLRGVFDGDISIIRQKVEPDKEADGQVP